MGDLIDLSVNPLMAPRDDRCRVCKLVAEPRDVTLRIFAPDLTLLPPKGAIEYLRSVGITATVRQVRSMVLSHQHHVQKFLERGGAVAPAQIAEGVSRIPPPLGNAAWVDVNQQGMNLGEQANSLLQKRLAELENKELIAVAKLGQTAASTRATLEMKGQLRRAEQLARLAAGVRKPADATA